MGQAHSNAGFLISLIVTSLAIAVGFHWAYAGRYLPVFIAAFIAWCGYLLAHYFATGEFIDEEIYSDPIPTDPEQIFKGSGGILILIVGIVVQAYGIGIGDLIITFTGSTFFLSGYVIAHHHFTDELL